MPVYARKTTIEDQFGARRTSDGSILCNWCNCDIADPLVNPAGVVYLIYTDKKHLNENIPHDVYCENCLKSHNHKAKILQVKP